MAIQRVIVMSNETSAQSGKAGAPPDEAEYNAVYAAVTATERGRWFLAEFANRNRKADADLILAAIARVEAAVRTGAAPQAAIPAAVQATSAQEAVSAGRGERDEPGVEEGVAKVVAADPPPADAAQELGQNTQALSDQDYSDAVAAIAASLTTRLEESTKNLIEDVAAQEPVSEPEPPSLPAAAEVAPAAEPARKGRVPQDNSPRWHIEAPDFVFGQSDADALIIGIEPQRGTAQLQSQLLGAEIMNSEIWNQAPEPDEVVSEAREEPPQFATDFPATVEVMPAPATTEEAAPEAVAPPSLSTPSLEIVPLSEIARPQLRIAREAMPSPRPPRYGSLTVTDALSEDEVIALFG
jgi:hypothetical protein